MVTIVQHLVQHVQIIIVAWTEHVYLDVNLDITVLNVKTDVVTAAITNVPQTDYVPEVVFLPFTEVIVTRPVHHRVQIASVIKRQVNVCHVAQEQLEITAISLVAIIVIKASVVLMAYAQKVVFRDSTGRIVTCNVDIVRITCVIQTRAYAQVCVKMATMEFTAIRLVVQIVSILNVTNLVLNAQIVIPVDMGIIALIHVVQTVAGILVINRLETVTRDVFRVGQEVNVSH